ncbi:MAG: hypothetical protein SVY53_13145, partial [Chloroflexota bacterium]|nr:hypothetical protein [Chloroflexota bacterium]
MLFCHRRGGRAFTPFLLKPIKPARLFLERRVHWVLIAPAVILLAALTLYPFAYALRLSLFRYNLARPWVECSFLGLGN